MKSFVIRDVRGVLQHTTFSNFSMAVVTLDGIAYMDVESAYQAAKTLDQAQRDRIWNASTPGEAKRLGRKVTMRSDWEDIKVGVMRDLLRQKFSPYQSAGSAARLVELLATGDEEMVEGNDWHDNWWGDCKCGRPECSAPGLNWLGRLLMEIREEFRGRQV